jgi:hypothetical protein
MVLESRCIGTDGYGQKNYRLILGGKELSEREAEDLVQEARFVEKTRLHSILCENLKEAAQKTMFDNARTADDIMFGKAILYCVSMQKNIIETVLNHKR